MEGAKVILEGEFHSGDLRNFRVSSAQIKSLIFICVGEEVKLWSCAMLGKLLLSDFFNVLKWVKWDDNTHGFFFFFFLVKAVVTYKTLRIVPGK